MPLPLRPTPDGDARETRNDPPALTAVERNALTVMAEHVRERAGLSHVRIFSRMPDAAAVDEVARVSAADAGDFSEDLARAAALGGGQRRFARGGLHVVSAAAHGRRTVTVAAAAPGGEALSDEAQAAIADLAEIAARVLGEPVAAQPREAQARRPPAPGVAYGVGLADALALLKRPPILMESRSRVVQALGTRYPSLGDAVAAIETDIGLATAVVSAANQVAKRPRDGVATVPDAIEALGPRSVVRLAARLPTLRPPGTDDRLGTAIARTAPHALATRTAADLIARHIGERARDEVRLVALLHDIGKVALAAASEPYLRSLGDTSSSPEDRISDERRRLAIDHAAIGAVAARRLGMPRSIAVAIERHHAEDARGIAAIVRLADMVAHEAVGEALSQPALAEALRTLRFDAADLHRLAYEIPRSREPAERSPEPSPLTPMQQRVLVGLASGKTYKQIAADLSVSESTVRTHLHNVYGKLEVMDRAQAVLLASERGWI